MANFSLSTSFFFFFALTLIPNSISTSSATNFDPQIALFGDAVLSDDHSRVVLTRPSLPSSGLLLLRKPFANPTSFSTEFAFSVSATNADGISLILVPDEENFELSKHSSPTSGGFLAVANVSSSDAKLGDREKLRSWIDYDASSKRLEVRVAKLEESRPYDPITAFAVDFPATWRDRQVLIGLKSSSLDSDSQISTVYSWSFRLRNLPNWVHSMPADPRAFKQSDHKKRVCPLAVLGGMVLATVCGALMALAVLSVWALVANRGKANEKGFNYEKVSVVVVGKDGV